MADALVRRGAIVVLVLLLALVAWAVGARLVGEAGAEDGDRGGRGAAGPAAVAVARVTTGTIAERLSIAGSLAPSARFVLAPEVGGRLVALHHDIGDVVERGEVVARLDDRSFAQAVVAAEAAVAVAVARLAEARSSVTVIRRTAERAATLVERGVAAESERDRTEAERLAAEAGIAVAEAQLEAARAELEAARLRLAETVVTADWDGDDEQRVVGQRYVDVGETLAAGQSVVSILGLDPLRAEIHIPEAGYSRIEPGSVASLRTAAWPEETFPAEVARIAPRFDPASRQALVVLRVPNAQRRLRPGMYVRAELVLDRRENTTLIPEAALVGRRGDPAVFAVSPDGSTVARVPVTVGLRDAGRVEVTGEGLTERVVILGHHLIEDGSAIIIPETGDTGP